MLFRILFCLFFGDFLFWMFQTQFGGVHGVVVVAMGVAMMIVKWGANAVAGVATGTAAAAAATGTGTGTCSNLQCDHFRRKCDIEWKASKDR